MQPFTNPSSPTPLPARSPFQTQHQYCEAVAQHIAQRVLHGFHDELNAKLQSIQSQTKEPTPCPNSHPNKPSPKLNKN